jgi:hypothetical protein
MSAPYQRCLPHSIDAEMAFLGGHLLYPEQKLGNGLKNQHFVMREHGWLFAAIREAQAAGLSFGLLEAEQWMANDPRFIHVGGVAYLTKLAELNVPPINAEEYAHLIIDLAAKRELISIAETLDAAAYAPDVAELADVLRDRVRKMLDEHEREYACRSAIEFSDIAEWASAAARAKTNIPMPEPYLWPLIFAGSRTYISGGTGIGKTMLGISICKALHLRMPFFRYKPGNVAPVVLFLDYEMGRAAMRTRLERFAIDGLFVVCFDDPELGDDGLVPLDTPEGQSQIRALIAATGAQVVFFDNLYSAVIGSIVGGSDKNGAHDKVVPFLKSLSKAGVASILFHHSGHEKSRAYGDDRYAWQMTSHLHIEAATDRADGELRIVLTEKKMRMDRQRAEPVNIVYDDETGTWETVQAVAKPAALSDRQQWLCAEAYRILDGKSFLVAERDYPVAYTTDLREAYKKKYFAHDPVGSAERMGWRRDVDGCVTYFTVEAMYFYKTVKP